MINPHEILTIDERRQQVKETLRPDTIRNHQVSEGLRLSPDQIADLEATAEVTRDIVTALHELSLRAITAERGDPLQRKIRQLLQLEPLFQHNIREGISNPTLPIPQITKVDTIMTREGIKIVEVEPGKIRGLGYGAMVRAQSTAAIGNGSGMTLGELSNDRPAAIVMSDKDKFHRPEMRLLASRVPHIVVASQGEITATSEGLKLNHTAELPRLAIMMSSLNKNSGINEAELRSASEIISDRRPDLEAKSALTILMNEAQDEDIEELLKQVLTQEQLQSIRTRVPKTTHASLETREKMSAIATQVASGDSAVFLKPIGNSGTRGIITPGNHEEAIRILNAPKELKKFVVQQALPTIMQHMHTMDVLSGQEGDALMNIRITLHVDTSGNIIEASAVGSPDEHLAHGGKTSVITSVERAQ